MDDLKDLKMKLYNLKNIIGIADGYTFYNSFYCDFMNALENKKEEILKYGEISLFKQECTALTLVAVSYTHLDVYKRQPFSLFIFIYWIISQKKYIFKYIFLFIHIFILKFHIFNYEVGILT